MAKSNLIWYEPLWSSCKRVPAFAPWFAGIRRVLSVFLIALFGLLIVLPAIALIATRSQSVSASVMREVAQVAAVLLSIAGLFLIGFYLLEFIVPISISPK